MCVCVFYMCRYIYIYIYTHTHTHCSANELGVSHVGSGSRPFESSLVKLTHAVDAPFSKIWRIGASNPLEQASSWCD